MISSENGLLRGAVLMNVRGRDVGGFVEEAKRTVKQQVAMPPGYFLSGPVNTRIKSVQRGASNSSSPLSCSSSSRFSIVRMAQ